MAESQGGSCEPCKRKKCKCDRQLPTCGQCATSPTLCKYAESNKRGIPSGYLGALETRLHETEAALYNALCELRRFNQTGTFSYSNVSEPLSSHQSNTSKAFKLAEWRRYPLQTSKDVENWWNSFRASQEINEEEHTQDRQGMAETYPSPAPAWQVPELGSLPSPRPEISMSIGSGPLVRANPSERAVYSAPEYNVDPRLQPGNMSLHESLSNQPQDHIHLPPPTPDGTNIANYDSLDSRSEAHFRNSVPVEEGQSQKSSRDGHRELNRSQQLSAKMSHIYY
ncbi:hypothetical protein EG329_007942 [Mollisiaceae sp. DMI_Dod_QoI]|nr:hypothetical protein EG329_007942 [Helotiales sp. DMI_Dod_QoI]